MRFSTWLFLSPGAPWTRTSAPRFSTAQLTRSGANEYGRNRLYPLTVGAAKGAIGPACESSPATYRRPTPDNASEDEANAFDRSGRFSSDWCRCQPEEKKFGSAGRHMNVASSPRRWQTCLTADRNSTAASDAAIPESGEKLTSICPGPHSSSIDRGSSPTPSSASRTASRTGPMPSSRTSDRYWYPRSNTLTAGGGGVNPASAADSGPPEGTTM